MERWWDKNMSTRCAAAINSFVGQLMARRRMPTAYATSGGVCVEQYNSAPTKLWQVGGHEARDVFFSQKADGAVVGADVNVEEIGVDTGPSSSTSYL
eukprot:6202449-Pleurochrysis_carterae.AAC.1